MKNKHYIIRWKDAAVEVDAFCVKDAMILAFAERIKQGKSYDDLSVIVETGEYDKPIDVSVSIIVSSW